MHLCAAQAPGGGQRLLVQHEDVHLVTACQPLDQGQKYRDHADFPAAIHTTRDHQCQFHALGPGAAARNCM